MRHCPITIRCCLGTLALLSASMAAAQVSYARPPRCEVWLEGEDCRDHNWVEGPVDNCWAFGAAGIHGGVLDLAHWRLPVAGRFYARFPFTVATGGEYVVYYLGRIPGCLASPLEWAVDDQPPQTCVAEDGWNVPGALDVVMSFKYALIRLGSADLSPGAHALTFGVRETCRDGHVGGMYSAQIDAIGLAPASWPVEPWEPPAPRAAPPDAASPVPDDLGRPGLSLTSGQLGAELSPTNGGLRGLRFDAEPPVALAGGAAVSPVEVSFRDGAARTGGRVTRTETEAGRLTLELTDEGLETRVVWEADAGSGELRMTAALTNRRQSPIWQVRLCVGEGLGVGGDGSDDTWLVGSRLLPPEQTADSQSLVAPYQFPFNLVCLSDPSASLYIMLADRDLLDTRIEFGRTAAAPDRGQLALVQYPRIMPGETWTSPPLIVGAYAGGDWRPAGDRFSRWWYSWAQTPVLPLWARGLGGISTGGTDLKDPTVVEGWRAEVAQADRLTGITALHGAWWFDSWTECFYPVQYRLSPDQIRTMRSVTDAVRAAGGRASIYSNALMLSRATADYELWGRDLATIDARGRVQLTEHDRHHHPMSLPYPNAVWGARFCEVLEPAVVAGRPDLLYIDQLGAVPAHLDFAPERHGHRHYGEWVVGSVAFLRTVQEQLGGQRPELVTFIETPCPALQQYTHFAYLSTNRVLRYVFPTYAGFVGGLGAVLPEEAGAIAEEGLLTGQPVTLHYSSLAEATAQQQEAMRSIVQLKKRVDPLLYTARFRDTVGLQVGAGLSATVFVAPDRLHIPFTNRQRVSGGDIVCDLSALGVALQGRARALVAGSEDAVEVAATRDARRRLVLTAPACAAGVVVVE